ncbi:helix-turn-helix domain-containing protein [Burkholderia cenocepacia]|uniref:helix-turn-helix domain-containing protein n=1 Tax=Burkholderia cenocepacia TaxID=95486 RepID=UPI001BA80BF7|nr:helix-turn-helix domain-containing protein [Burkholderia cenocepacia]QUN44716.1 helix-turn-helix domain-containing protein [Burkholderia cenocepacia]QUO26124.1 helix-turn-helix domain-containing protein [Burkholderia cenocepacia]
MSYGLDLSDCRFVTDHKGNRLRADVPYHVFSMLVEFRQAALRSQTERVENATRPGMYRAALGAAVTTEQQPAVTSTPSRFKSSKRSQLEALFEPAVPIVPVVPIVEAAPVPTPTPAPSPRKNARTRVYFPREFRESIPEPVAHAIGNGTYFLRAWREYRQLSKYEAAELAGLSADTILWHEQGYSIPGNDTLKRFADIYDCALDQLLPKDKSDVAPTMKVTKAVTPEAPKMKFAPVDTDYPDAVLAHIVSGKSPITAWRLHRHMTLKDLAEAYGTSKYNLQKMEDSLNLRGKTLEKFCGIFHCQMNQLYRPEGLQVEPHKVRSRRPAAKANHSSVTL